MNAFARIIIFLPLILFFFPAFVFYFPLLKAPYLIYFVTLYLSIILIFIFYREKAVSTFYRVVKKTPLKFFILVLILMSLNAIFLSFFGSASLVQSIRSIIMQFVLYILPILFYYIFIIDRLISFKKFMNIFMILFWINLLIGFVAYIGQLLDIELINNIFEFFSNLRIINSMHNGFDAIGDNSIGHNYTAFGLPRLDNLNEEPGHYAQVLYLFLPFAYGYFGLKSAILKNNNLSIFIKKTILPFTCLSLILTLSPIFLVLSVFLTIILFFDKIVYVYKRFFLVFVILFAIILLVFCNIDLSDTYLSRITNLFTEVHSFDDFVDIEPSLASRVYCYVNSFCVFLKHPIVGVGHGNLARVIIDQYLQSSLPPVPTVTIATKAVYAVSQTAFLLRAFIYVFLAENGIFIFLVFAYFYYKLIKNIDNIQKKYKKNHYVYKYGWMLKGTLIALIINSFYELNFLYINLYFIIALSIMYIYEFGVKTKIFNKKLIILSKENYVNQPKS